MKRVHMIKQLDETDCGAAALAMILDHYGKKLPLAQIREAIRVDQQGASIYGLWDGAEHFGLSVQTQEGDADAAWNAMQAGDISFPAVIRIVNKDNYTHYVVVCGIKKDKLYVNDPGEGKMRLTREQFGACFQGQIMVFQPTEQFRKENRKKGSLSRFIGMVSRQKALLFIIGILSLAVTSIGIVGSLIFQYLVDHVLANIQEPVLLDTGLDTFAVLIGAMAMLYAFKLTVEMLRGKLLTVMSKNIDLPLMLGYNEHVTDLPMSFFDTHKTGEITSRYNDASAIRSAISSVSLTLMIDVVMTIICAVVLWNRSQSLFCISLIIFLLYILVSLFYVRPLDRFNRELMEQNAQFSSYLKESIDGMETVKSTQAEHAVKTKTATMFSRYLNRSIRGSLLSLSKDSIIEFITSVGTLVLLWVGALNVINGEMTTGSLITFITLLSYFLSPIQNIVELQSSLQTALVAADRLNSVLDLQVEHSGDTIPPQGMDGIAFENVSFRYGFRNLVLDGLTFSAKRGEQIALVGESGCGKSTVTKLLMGFYTPESGQVSVSGVPVSQLSLKWLRSNTAYVPQDTFLFSDTVLNNLQLGLEEDKLPTEEEMTRVLDACGCEFIKRLPFGLYSRLEENGADLSGGQRQRLAIARALLRKPKLLILDEATSALDTITEYRIQNAIRKLYPDMTVVMVAHRLSTVKQCDQILVMSNGAIVEQGTHTTLMEKQHSYAELWKRQNIA